MTETAKKKLTLSKSDRIKVWWRSTFLQGSWNYERMLVLVLDHPKNQVLPFSAH